MLDLAVRILEMYLSTYDTPRCPILLHFAHCATQINAGTPKHRFFTNMPKYLLDLHSERDDEENYRLYQRLFKFQAHPSLRTAVQPVCHKTMESFPRSLAGVPTQVFLALHLIHFFD